MRTETSIFAIVFLCLSPLSTTVANAINRTETDPEQSYQSLISYRVAYSSLLSNLKVTRDAGSFEFRSGKIDIIEPVQGRYHAAVFEGEGLFCFEPPTQIEKDQLTKFAKCSKLEEEFETVVLRFTDDTAEEFMAALGIDSASGTQERQVSIKCRDSMKRIMEEHLRNIDSRVLSDFVSGAKGYFFADISSRTKGKIIFEIDPESREEISLSQHNRAPVEVIDIWSSFHLADQYQGENPALDKPGDIIEIPHFEADLTLDKNGGIKAIAVLSCVALEKSVAAIPFMISSLVNVDEVKDEQGRPCFFVHEIARERAGQPPLKQDKLVVCLPAPFLEGENRKLTICYHSKDLIKKYGVWGLYESFDTLLWYPRYKESGRSTCKLTYRFPRDLELISVGKKIREWEEDGRRCGLWEQDLPVTGIGFTLGDLERYQISVEGLPNVDVYSGGFQIDKKQMHNTAADVINSLNFFQKIFTPYPFPGIIATLVPMSYGQGFPGFLTLSQYSFNGQAYSGINEAFRAHEVAHQWWGHIVGWETYHDQWLSEGFAEYFGALFAHLAQTGQKSNLFQQIVGNWKNDILNQGNLAFVRFGYPKLSKRLTMGSKSGPIWLGRRLTSSKSPLDYQILVYEKGAYVLHMLMMMMRDLKKNSDDNFLAMMKEFIETYAWKEANTEDFRRVVEKYTRMDMKWFFDQWIYGTHIPAYKFDWRTEPADEGKWFLDLRVEQADVPEGFRMPVLFLIDFGKGRSSIIRCLVDKPINTLRISFPEKPRNVEFNFNGSVLSRLT